MLSRVTVIDHNANELNNCTGNNTDQSIDFLKYFFSEKIRPLTNLDTFSLSGGGEFAVWQLISANIVNPHIRNVSFFLKPFEDPETPIVQGITLYK